MPIKLTKEHRAVIERDGEKAAFVLRDPSNKELNDFLAARYALGRRNRMQDNSLPARIEFFDLLLTGVEDLVDAEGTPVTPERKDCIPLSWKSEVIFRTFEDNEIDVKN